MRPDEQARPDLSRRTLNQSQQMFRDVYGTRNRLRSNPERALLRLVAKMGVLAECVRKDAADVEHALAAVAGRMFAIANLLELDMEELVLEKYPGLCIKCGRVSDCSCLDVYEGPPMQVVPDYPDGIALDELQQMLKRIYGQSNEAQGRDKVFGHLNEEIGEFATALLDADLRWIHQELADLFAWWLGYLTLRGIVSVSALLYEFYPDACSACGQNPCPTEGPCPPL